MLINQHSRDKPGLIWAAPGPILCAQGSPAQGCWPGLGMRGDGQILHASPWYATRCQSASATFHHVLVLDFIPLDTDPTPAHSLYMHGLLCGWKKALRGRLRRVTSTGESVHGLVWALLWRRDCNTKVGSQADAIPPTTHVPAKSRSGKVYHEACVLHCLSQGLLAGTSATDRQLRTNTAGLCAGDAACVHGVGCCLCAGDPACVHGVPMPCRVDDS